MVASSPTWLPASEVEEFNQVTYETIKSYKDVSKLKRLEKYMREEGFLQTAEIARQTILEQQGGDLLDLESRISDPEADDLINSINDWQTFIKGKDLKLKELQQSKAATRLEGKLMNNEKTVAPIPKLRKQILETSEAIVENKLVLQSQKAERSHLKHDLRSGREYYEKWDKFVSEWDKADETQRDRDAQPEDKAILNKLKSVGDESGDLPTYLPQREGPMVFEEIEDEECNLRKGSILEEEKLGKQLGQPVSPNKKAAATLSTKDNIRLLVDKGSNDWETQMKYETNDKQQAEEERLKGNLHFKKGQYRMATASYSKSLQLYSGMAKTFANRALCHLKLARPEDAIADCTQALHLDKSYTKAYYRRAIAKQQMGDFNGALEDFQAVMSLFPNDENVKRKTEELRKEIKKREQMEPGDTARCQVGVKVQRTSENWAKPSRRIKNAENRAAGAMKLLRNQYEKAPIQVPQKPKTALEFERACVCLMKQPVLLRQYIQLIEANSYPNIFKDALSSSFIKIMAESLQAGFMPHEPKGALFMLQGLAKVRRFGVIMKFLPPNDKQAYATIFEWLVRSDVVPLEAILNLKVQYLCDS